MLLQTKKEEKIHSINTGLLDQVVLGEISGKNNAIHAYDKIIWTIRSGYLTLVFVGWSLIVKSYAEIGTQAKVIFLMKAMLLLTAGLSMGGWIIDRNFTRRKFRVIFCLNKLIIAIKNSNGKHEEIPAKLLQVSGDDGDAEYNCSGYKQASLVGGLVYAITLTTLILVFLVFKA